MKVKNDKETDIHYIQFKAILFQKAPAISPGL